MKINEVEALAGISKKNIRFYEEQGLLTPRRNAENGYRDYGEEEVAILRRIRLLRKLGVPIEEIRQMFSGSYTVGDVMRRHSITLERERRNLDQSIDLCRELQTMELPVSELDTEGILSRMEEMERGGTTFRNDQKQDIRVQYVAPVTVTAAVVVFVAAMIGVLLWALRIAPEDAPPWWFLAVIIGILAAVCVGTVAALTQRIREIRKGEIDDAKYY